MKLWSGFDTWIDVKPDLRQIVQLHLAVSGPARVFWMSCGEISAKMAYLLAMGRFGRTGRGMVAS